MASKVADKVLELLVAHGAGVDQKRDGRTPLHYLIGHRMPANASWFLARGGDALRFSPRAGAFSKILVPGETIAARFIRGIANL